MKIAFYSPYLSIFGGGERYLLTMAEYLSQKNVVNLFGAAQIREKANIIFNIPLKRIQFLPEENFRKKNLFKKIFFFRHFDIFFYMSDGSLFFSPCLKNFLIIQSPLHIPSSSLFNKLKLFNWKIICYSQFMFKIIKKKLGLSPIILPPAIDIVQFKSDITEKKNIILSVGRFFSHLHNKKHDFLIKVFKKYFPTLFKNWKLIIVGGFSDKEGEAKLKNLQVQSKGYPIEILTGISFESLCSLYKKAKIYWHATGYGEDLKRYPEKAEHFGITTLEAMAAGCVPVVFAAGGQIEIVKDGLNGFLWQSEEELIHKTKILINNYKLYKNLCYSAQKKAEDFSLNLFYEKLNRIISS